MDSKSAELVTALAQGKMSTANESFARLMAQKVNDALDARKVAVASQIYNSSTESK